MSFHHLDQYAAVPSPVTAMPPLARLVGAASVAVAAATLPLGTWAEAAVLGALVVIMTVAARVPVPVLLRRTAGPLAFVLVASVGLVVFVPGEPVLDLGWTTVTRPGVERFGFVLARAVVALAAAVLLVTTTGFPDLLHALRRLRLPRVVTTALSLAYRLIYLLMEETERLLRAARSRNAGAGAATRRRIAAGVAAAVLQRAFARAERTHRAMLARGYTGDLPTLAEWRWRPWMTVAHAALLAVVAATAAVARL